MADQQPKSKTSAFIGLQSLLDLSLVLHEVEDGSSIWRMVALTILGKFKASAVGIGKQEEYPQALRWQGSSRAVQWLQRRLSQSEIPGGSYLCDCLRAHPSGLWLCIARRSVFGPLSLEEHRYGELVLSIAAHAYQLWERKQQVYRLWRDRERKNQLLQASLDITKAFARIWKLEEIQHLLGLVLRGQFRTSHYAFALWGDDVNVVENRLEPVISDISKVWQSGTWSFGSSYLGTGAQWGEQGKLVIIVETQAMAAEERLAQEWFLETIASVVATALERYRLIQQELERRKLEEELQLAARIQRQLFPKTVALPEPYQFFAHNVPSRFVGGDYYDVVFRSTVQRWLFVIADVSGKGIPASLLMANFQAALHILAQDSLSIAQLASRLNAHLVAHTHPEQFVTCFLLELDPNTATATTLNAGHFPPLLILPAGSVQTLSAGGLPMGMFEKTEYESEAITLASGSLLCAYTDGVVEARNPAGEQFGEQRLLAYLQQWDEQPLDQIGTQLIERVLQWSEAELQDDLTLLLLRYR